MVVTSVALSAERGAGKTSLAEAACAALGLTHISVSGWLRDVLSAGDRAVGPDELRQAGAAAARDPARLVAACLAHAGWAPGAPVLFDAVRHVEVLSALRHALAPDPVLHVALVVPGPVRAARLTARGDAQAVLAGAGHSTEQQVAGLEMIADAVLDASRTMDELVRDLDAWVRQDRR